MWTVAQLARDLAAGRTSSRELVESALARIARPYGEGPRAFLKVYEDAARADADHADELVAGDVTRAGSKIRADAPPAKADAPAVARLRAAGAVLLGRTNMVEFAFGGVGLNPHYGTPRNPWDRAGARVPGGSSSGAAVAQAEGMCVMALGTDTRGSIRAPAALCGVVGWKPTTRRVPREGAFPLSYTLDSVGPLANTVACCAAYDAVLAGEPGAELTALDVRGLRLLLPRSSALADLDREVERAFQAALRRFAERGALIDERAVPALDRQAEYFKGGGFAGAEAYHIHRAYLDRLADYDPRVGQRLLLGKDISAADYVALGELRTAYQREVGAAAAPYDAIVMPTVPCVAPTIAQTEASMDDYVRWNMRILRNTGLVNFLDGCAVSVPCHEPGTAPVGLTVCATAGTDRHTLAVAAALERALERH
ncbi:MAG: amidase [Betaproteobacteria bacterium]|nr:MAG: amidase [Betaproteobacteria bacterium]